MSAEGASGAAPASAPAPQATAAAAAAPAAAPAAGPPPPRPSAPQPPPGSEIPVAPTVPTAPAAPAAPAARPPPDPAPIPTMTEYKKQQAAVRGFIAKRAEIDKKLAALEESIAAKELAYLESTPNGNIIVGYDHYMKGSGGGAQRRKTWLADQYRVFSRSSVSYRPGTGGDISGATTPALSHAPTPLSSTFRDGGQLSAVTIGGASTPTSATAAGSSSVKGATATGHRKRKSEDDPSDGEGGPGGSNNNKKRMNFGAARK